MSGVIPPSIVNYEWQVKINDPSYLNISFPFRVKIESIWFTTHQLFNGTNGLWEGVADIETTERELTLCAVKTKNSKTQHGQYDNPTDYMWSIFENVGYYEEPSDLLKPTMWLGNPDNAEGRIGAFSAQPNFGSGTLDLRSTAKSPIDKARVFNNSWNNEEWIANTYLADSAVMNTDEFLQLFVYANGGDWTDYDNSGLVTISVAYTGASFEDAQSASAKPWTDWWND